MLTGSFRLPLSEPKRPVLLLICPQSMPSAGDYLIRSVPHADYFRSADDSPRISSLFSREAWNAARNPRPNSARAFLGCSFLSDEPLSALLFYLRVSGV